MDKDIFGILMEEHEKAIEELEMISDHYKMAIAEDPNVQELNASEGWPASEQVVSYVFTHIINVQRRQHGLIVKLEHELGSMKKQLSDLIQGQ